VSVTLFVEVQKHIGLVIERVAVSDSKLFDCNQIIVYLIPIRLDESL
jgi:hypothetical protein